jgi:hypothetical protein
MAICESFRKKYGVGFWRHELGAIVVVALKNALKGSGLAYGSLPYFDELCVALPNAARHRQAASKGGNGWRVDSDWRPLASILSLRRLRRHD